MAEDGRSVLHRRGRIPLRGRPAKGADQVQGIPGNKTRLTESTPAGY